MNDPQHPQPWTPLDTFPLLVWKHIYPYLDRECMLSIRTFTSALDCFIPPKYNPTLQLDEVVTLLSPYLNTNEIWSLRKVNSFWHQSTDNFLELQASDWHGEIIPGKPSAHLMFSSAADIEAFQRAFRNIWYEVSVHAVVLRRVVLRVPTTEQAMDSFMHATEMLFSVRRIVGHIWHLRIDTDPVNEFKVHYFHMNVSFVLKLLINAWNIKSLYWSTNFMEGLNEEPQMSPSESNYIRYCHLEHLQKFQMVPFLPIIGSLLTLTFSRSLKTLEINCHSKWGALREKSFEQVNQLKIEVTPTDTSQLESFARSTKWQLSSFHIVFRMNSLQPLESLRKMIGESQESLKELSIMLKASEGNSASLNGALELMQHELRLPNLKRLQLTNFVESSFDCLTTFVPNVEILKLVNSVLMHDVTILFNGDWKTECWKNVEIDPQAWGTLKCLKQVTIAADMASELEEENRKLSRVFLRPQL